ncbi:MAG: LLM class flavin-dependent oxidoreductase, partial [Candidatus Hermodarchaeota archaeon]|nr:LLM class flavin-dependent oxidoreductase [Candidatus Hermodarchaeota archaeon]
MSNLSFGIKTAPMHTTYDGILKVWKEADSIPVFQHAWLFDHFAPIQGSLDGPCLEAWTLLSALAAETNRIRIGIMVTGNTYRHPAVLANMVATVDIISNGRL